MDEDLSVKAPLTRLRRRLSVESEDSSLPTTPSTPNKKRATRLAAKPQLELIDEVATDNVPKRTTRKAAVKENAEAGLNSGTPTALTPSRRSTRIRSNTSILSETTAQNVESPRAKRATRRNSQLGSDNESAVVTPAKQTRRPRKTSTAKVDKPPGDENFVEVTTTNTEDLEKDSKDSKASETDNHSPSTRKSARFNKKGSEVDDETYKANKESNQTLNDSVNTNKALKDSTPVKESNKILNDSVNANKSLKETTSVNEPNKTLNDSVKTNKSLIDATPVEESNKILNDSVHTNESLKESTPVEESNKSLNHSVITNKSLKESTPVKNEKQINTNNETSPQVNNNEEKLSTSSTNLIYEIKTINKNDLNKSTSSIEKIANNSKNKRNRTKSWTTISSPSNIEFISDNEEAKKKRKKKTPNTSIISGAGDASITNDATEMTSQRDIKSLNRSVNLNKSSLRNLVTPCVVSVARVEFDKSDTVKLFENSPGYHQPLVLIEDSDSCSADKLIIDIQESEDQCVPVVVNPTNESLNKHEQSVEPMDIDESMPVNVTINDFSDKSNTSKEEVEMPDKRKSSISEKTSSKDDSINKSKKKTSISNQSASESPKSSMVEDLKSEAVNKSKNSSSKRNSLTSVYNLNGSTTNKSNKTSSISEVADEVDSGESKKSSDNSLRKSLITIGEDNAKLNESANKCKEKSPVSVNNSIIQNDLKKSIDNTQKNLSISIDEDIEKQNTKKSKRNTSISLNESAANQKSLVDENNDSKSSNKSKRRSVSQTDSQSLENKSTLVISQLQDVSTNDTSPNVTNNELSKSLSGPDKKNKGLDKKNISLNNYLTSTPIQQKPFQKLTMQMNTSIISPSIEDKNKANEKTPKKSVATESLDSATDEEIKFKNKKEMVTLPKQKFSRAPSSSESSDNESDMESKAPIKIPDKKSPIKKLESSDSDEESDSNSLQSNKKSPNKKLFNRPELKTKNVKTPNKFPTSDSSDTDDSDEVASKNRSKMFDDEASEASDDYQSGDSQDKEDRRYEEEHEIIEKGETLDSEEELSNDSDYEKDSFLVSSDAEDNDMLSGSGDDLSMSDNELTMSAKSKTKFNERKLKQQKKASREMYEARHDKNADTKVEITKSKKTKRQRLESSNLESENENVEPKKSNRLRIDSSQDGSMTQSDADESIRIKKKKSKRLSESIHDITTNEIEVTMCNQSTTEKNDPLSVAIKQEPKTPQKNFDISTVAINDKIEEVEMDANASILRRNETLDPLQATGVVDFEDSSSSSDNMEIVQMYDSLLSHLKSQTNKIKTADTSLNLNKKSKKSKDPVIDQLNLTQTKKSNMNKNKPGQKSQAKESSTANNVEENSSDSIDMRLLFPDDSNDSDMNANQFNPNIQAEAAENFIPLKRTDAQTNIPGNMDMSVSELNVSKKNKERKSSQLSPEEILNIPDNSEEPEDSNIKIIIDTKGTHEEVEPPAVLTNSNKKKKKNKSLNESKALEITGDIDWTDGNVETVEASFTSEKNKKKNKHDTSQIVEPLVKAITSAKKLKKTSLCVEDVQPEMQNTEPKEMPAVSSMTSEKKKKKNKQSLQTSQTIVDKTGEESDNEAPIERSYKSEKKSDGADTVTDEAPTSSEKKKHKKNKKKKKNKNLSQSMDKSDDNSLRTNEQEIDGSSKRKRKFYESTQTEDITNAIPLYTLTTSNEKKKRKVLQENESIDGDNVTFSADGNITKKSKKNKKVQNKDDIEQDPLHNTKKRKYSDDDNEQKVSKVSKQNSFDKIHVPTLPDSIINKLSENPQNKFSKKKKTKLAVIATMPFVVEEAERRVNKPSNYLEQSIYLNDTPVKTKQKRIKDKPKVLPFIPTALTSDSGYTSQFNVNVLPEDTQFVAQAINVENFRESFLATQRIKKLGTLERCKAHRSRKISKF